MKDEVTKVLQHEAQAVLDIPVKDSFESAVHLLHRQVHESGMGKAGEIAQNISTTFSSTGTPAVFLHPSEAQHGDLGVIQPNDALLLISNSGKTREILELVKPAHGLYPSPPLIVIGNPKSALAEFADAYKRLNISH